MKIKIRNKKNGLVATVDDRLGRAMIAMGTHISAEVEACEKVKPKRKYKRRDMRAE